MKTPTYRVHLAFLATDALATAIDRAAALTGTTRSHFLRQLAADHCRQLGTLGLKAPASMLDVRRQAREATA